MKINGITISDTVLVMEIEEFLHDLKEDYEGQARYGKDREEIFRAKAKADLLDRVLLFPIKR